MQRPLLLLLALSSTDAFSLSPSVAPHASLRTQSKATPKVRMSLAAEGVRVVASLPVLYSLLSFNEYMIHRYYQHEEIKQHPRMKNAAEAAGLKFSGNGHVEHHAETYDDMGLKDDAKWMTTPAAKQLSSDEFRGTAISWSVVAQISVALLPTMLPVYHVMGFNPLETVAIALIAVSGQGLVWNALHPDMHGLPEVPGNWGPPSEWLAGYRGSAYFNWLYQNHEGHHVAGGRANYNVACPMFDHILGTYMEEEAWRPRMRPRPSAIREAEALAEASGAKTELVSV